MWILSFAFLWEAIISDWISSGPPWHEGRGRYGESREDLLSQPWKGRGHGQWWRGTFCCYGARMLFQVDRLVMGCLLSAASGLMSSRRPRFPESGVMPSAYHGSSSLLPASRPELEAQEGHFGEERAHCQCSKRTGLMPLETIASPWAFLMINPPSAHTLIDAGRANKKLLHISISLPFFLVQTGQSLSLLLIKDSRNWGND